VGLDDMAADGACEVSTGPSTGALVLTGKSTGAPRGTETGPLAGMGALGLNEDCGEASGDLTGTLGLDGLVAGAGDSKIGLRLGVAIGKLTGALAGALVLDGAADGNGAVGPGTGP
jgi:hypothetical protein